MPNGVITGNTFELSSLRGGLDDTSPYMKMEPDVCVVAENVEFIRSTLGERRKGCAAISLPAGLTSDANVDAVTWMSKHLPTNDPTASELWLLGQSLSVDYSVIWKQTTAGWSLVSIDDAYQVGAGQGHRLSGQTLHGKFFVAGKTAQDRMHLYDGTRIRRAGQAAPAAPTAVDTGAAGAFAGTRYYRVRYIILSGSTLVARSEPSATLTFTPAGTKTGAVVTKPASTGEHETHWELEASLDNANFYRIAQTVVGTTTVTDTSTVYAGAFPLSENIGKYSLIPSGKFLTVDNDRLLIGGSWESSAQASRITWTPVYRDEAGASDERIDLTADPFIDLDGFEGGELTGLSRNVNGYVYAFKRSHIYQLNRTGTRTAAYEATPLTKDRGALPGSLVEAIDQSGAPTLYFLDAAVGPMRLGSNGLQWCGRDIQTTWKRVNVNATTPCHGVYYSYNRQLHFWVALDGADYPNFKFVLHVNEMRDTDEGARRGWVTVSKGSRIATAHCSMMFSDNVDSTGNPRSYTLVPLIGKQYWTVGATRITNFVQRCDTGGTDAFTTGDTAATYQGIVTSRPFSLLGLLSEFEVKAAALLMKAETTPDGVVYFELIKNFGAESFMREVPFLVGGGETHVIHSVPEVGMAEMQTIQISMGDLNSSILPPSSWELDMLNLKIVAGNTA